MRIVNVLPDPRHFSYASTASGGKTLQSGQVGPELPFSVINEPGLWKDLESGKAQIRLSDEDRKLIAKILAHGGRKIVVQKRVAPPKPKAKPKATSKAKKAKTQILEPTGKKTKRVPAKPVTKEALKKGTISLKDLEAASSAGAPDFTGKKPSMSDIKKHMGSRV